MLDGLLTRTLSQVDMLLKMFLTDVKIDGKDYLLIPGREILGKFEKVAKTGKKK